MKDMIPENVNKYEWGIVNFSSFDSIMNLILWNNKII